MFPKSVPKELIMDGVSSAQSYLVMARKKRLGLHVAFSPRVGRITDDVIIVGGKLRIAYDSGYTSSRKSKAVKAINEKVAISTLKTAYDADGAKWSKELPERVSGVYAKPVAAGLYDGEEFEASGAVEEIVASLMDGLEGTVGFKTENARKIRESLVAYFAENVKKVFKPLPEITKLPVSLVGSFGNLAIDGTGEGLSYTKNVVSFADKLAVRKAKAAK